MSYQPRVFVVMPFGVKSVGLRGDRAQGKADAAVDVDFNRVYDELLKPAIVNADCQPFRADKEPSAGDIRIDMFFELVTADIVLADISALNANVFYELGIRHGVASNGVFVLHGGWGFDRPFDVAPDRAFDYNGMLFEKNTADDAARQSSIASAVNRLSQILTNAFAHDTQSVGSPVYSHLPGLVPVDWQGLQNARAKYFGGLLNDWESRIAKARAKGFPGDILTLAEDTPTRFHREKLLFAAARSLMDLCRFDIAKTVLDEVVSIAPTHLEARCQLGLALGRLGDTTSAIQYMEALVRDFRGDADAQGVLGRVYKDLWRSGWWDKADVPTRQSTAILQAGRAAAAIHSYYAALERNASSYFNSINALTLTRVLEHLHEVTKRPMPPLSGIDMESLPSVVKFAADAAGRQALDDDDQAEQIWSAATLGELAVLDGDAASAEALFAQACGVPGITAFQKQSMLGNLQLFERLAFSPEATGKAIETIQATLSGDDASPARFGRVVVFSGHMTDTPDRAVPRFPGSKEGVVRKQLEAILTGWNIGKGDLAISGAARGGDILFAEICRAKGAHVRLLLPRHEGDFVKDSVALPGANWEDRFYDLIRTCEHWFQDEHLGAPPEGESQHLRNNLWVLNTARAEAIAGGLYGALVWDEKSTGDGVGGTSHFASEVERLNGQIKVVNPTLL